MTQAEAEFNATGRPARVFKDFRYRTRHSWTSERRVVGKAEFLDKGANPRFVVTSLSPERLGARALYEDFYCARGDMENRIKEQQLGLFRRPDQRGNDARQSTPAVSVLRRLLAHARLASSRTEADPPGSRSVSDDSLKLLKIGAQVRLTVRHVWISMSEAYPYSEVFAAVVRNLQAIPLRC